VNVRLWKVDRWVSALFKDVQFPLSNVKESSKSFSIMYLSLIAVCGLLTSTIAAPTAPSKQHVVHERRATLPTHWNRNAKLHGDSVIPMRIGLTQSNLEKADEFLMDLAHPESPNFGKHVSYTARRICPLLEWFVRLYNLKF